MTSKQDSTRNQTHNAIDNSTQNKRNIITDDQHTNIKERVRGREGRRRKV